MSIQLSENTHFIRLPETTRAEIGCLLHLDVELKNLVNISYELMDTFIRPSKLVIKPRNRKSS
jgi:hypothetical protein